MIRLAAAAIRVICGVRPRRELDTDPAARRRWRDLVADYRAWERG